MSVELARVYTQLNKLYTDNLAEINAVGEPKKAMFRWNEAFREFQIAKTKDEQFAATGTIFQTGAEYIRDDLQYTKFRRNYHHLYDLIGSL